MIHKEMKVAGSYKSLGLQGSPPTSLLSSGPHSSHRHTPAAVGRCSGKTMWSFQPSVAVVRSSE